MTRIAGCRSCAATGLAAVLDLGMLPLANALLREEDLGRPEPRRPLELVHCASCGLVQITETVPPELLFRDYVYFSSYSDGMVAHARELVARLVRERGLGARDLAVEIASNDGYLLQWYARASVPVLGIEPARNVAAVAERERGVPTLSEFFGLELAQRLAAQGKRASVLHANNVLAHVADLNGFVAGIAVLLARRGAALIEVPYLGEMIPRLEFDTIYHEHLCYFSLRALEALFRRHALVVADVEEIALHGGSLLLTVAHAGEAVASPRVEALRERERAQGLGAAAYYADFASRVARWRGEFRDFLAEQGRAGRRVAAYGAAAKGATLLNVAGAGREQIAFVADRSKHKHGLYMPGVRIPIVPAEALLDEQPEVCVLLAWNFRDEILAQQAEYVRRGGRFAVPIPEVTFV